MPMRVVRLTPMLLLFASTCTLAEDACRAPEVVAWQHALGALHNHSGYSDGAPGTSPASYYQAGRDRGLQFLGGTEHSDVYLGPASLPLTVNSDCVSEQFPDCVASSPGDRSESVRKWEATAAQAAAATGAGFVALRGFEWTSDRFGHINVFFSSNTLNAKAGPGYVLSMELFWQWLATPAAIGGGADGLVSFNHPGREDDLHRNAPFGDPGYAFNAFEFRPEVADRVFGLEVFGKGSHYDYDCGDDIAECVQGSYLAYALDQGWHLAPIGSEDHHARNWASPELPKTVVLLDPAQGLTEAAIRAAMLERRTYALAQEFNDLRVNFDAVTKGRPALVGGPSGNGGSARQADGQPQRFPPGSRLRAAAGTRVQFRASLDETGMQVPVRYELISNGGRVVAADPRSLDAAGEPAPGTRWTVATTGEEQYYFLRVLLLGDARPIAYVSPIWLQADDTVTGPCALPFAPAAGES